MLSSMYVMPSAKITTCKPRYLNLPYPNNFDLSPEFGLCWTSEWLSAALVAFNFNCHVKPARFAMKRISLWKQNLTCYVQTIGCRVHQTMVSRLTIKNWGINLLIDFQGMDLYIVNLCLYCLYINIQQLNEDVIYMIVHRCILCQPMQP